MRRAPNACATSGSSPSSSPMAKIATARKTVDARPTAPIAAAPRPPTIIVSTIPIDTQPSSANTRGVASRSIGPNSCRIIQRYSMVVRAAVSVAFLLLAFVSAGAQQQPETLSLLGKPLAPPSIPDDTRRKLESDLATVRATYNKDPNNVDAIIWLGRRTAYLSRF